MGRDRIAVFAGLDIGDRYTHSCVVDVAGEVVEETRLPTVAGALERYFSGRDRMRVGLEVGVHCSKGETP